MSHDNQPHESDDDQTIVLDESIADTSEFDSVAIKAKALQERNIRIRAAMSSLQTNEPWSHFFVSIAYLVLLPAFPLIIEHIFTNQITLSSTLLIASIYSFSLFASSDKVIVKGFGPLLGLIFAIFYASPTDRIHNDNYYNAILLTNSFGLLIVLGFHIHELFVRHIRHGLPFLRSN